jgi:hypothetical protein
MRTARTAWFVRAQRSTLTSAPTSGMSPATTERGPAGGRRRGLWGEALRRNRMRRRPGRLRPPTSHRVLSGGHATAPGSIPGPFVAARGSARELRGGRRGALLHGRAFGRHARRLQRGRLGLESRCRRARGGSRRVARRDNTQQGNGDKNFLDHDNASSGSLPDRPARNAMWGSGRSGPPPLTLSADRRRRRTRVGVIRCSAVAAGDVPHHQTAVTQRC